MWKPLNTFQLPRLVRGTRFTSLFRNAELACGEGANQNRLREFCFPKQACETSTRYVPTKLKLAIWTVSWGESSFPEWHGWITWVQHLVGRSGPGWGATFPKIDNAVSFFRARLGRKLTCAKICGGGGTFLGACWEEMWNLTQPLARWSLISRFGALSSGNVLEYEVRKFAMLCHRKKFLSRGKHLSMIRYSPKVQSLERLHSEQGCSVAPPHHRGLPLKIYCLLGSKGQSWEHPRFCTDPKNFLDICELQLPVFKGQWTPNDFVIGLTFVRYTLSFAQRHNLLYTGVQYSKGRFLLCSFAFLVAMGDTATANLFLMMPEPIIFERAVRPTASLL